MRNSNYVHVTMIMGIALTVPETFAQEVGEPADHAIVRYQGQSDPTAFYRFQARPAEGPDQRMVWRPDPQGLTNLYAFTVNPARDSTFGATLEPAPARLRDQLKLPEGQGLIVGSVDPDGPAASAGLKTNDILLSLQDRDLGKPEDLTEALERADDKELTLKIVRAGKPLTLKVRKVVKVTFGPIAESKERTQYILGVSISVPDDALRAHLDLPKDRGLLVDQVAKGSAAEKGGVKQNDVLISIAGQPLEGTDGLVTRVAELKDHPTELRLMREGKLLTLVVTPEKRTVSERFPAAREPSRLFMFDPSRAGVRTPMPGMPPINAPGMTFRPLNPGGPDPRVEKLETELRSLRKAIEELKDAVNSGKSPRERD